MWEISREFQGVNYQLFAQLSIFGCTKTDGKRNRTAQGNDGWENQSVRKSA